MMHAPSCPGSICFITINKCADLVKTLLMDLGKRHGFLSHEYLFFSLNQITIKKKTCGDCTKGRNTFSPFSVA